MRSWIWNDEAQRIPKPILVRIREQQLPRMTSIRRLVEPRKISLAGRHHDRRMCIERLNSAKIQVLRTRRHRTRLPQISTIFGPQHRAIGPRSPRDSASNVVDSAQIGSGVGVLNLPLGMGSTRQRQQPETERNSLHIESVANHCPNSANSPSSLHSKINKPTLRIGRDELHRQLIAHVEPLAAVHHHSFNVRLERADECAVLVDAGDDGRKAFADARM